MPLEVGTATSDNTPKALTNYSPSGWSAATTLGSQKVKIMNAESVPAVQGEPFPGFFGLIWPNPRVVAALQPLG